MSAHLADHQQHWHPYEQELWGLLTVVRERVKQLGRIPSVNHTDHANLARLDALELVRIDPKHYRWYAEVVQGGSLLYHRPGVNALHKGPDGLSRNVEGRDQLILAKSSDWEGWRERIKGIQQSLRDGTAEDEDQEAVTTDKVPVEALKPPCKRTCSIAAL